MPLRFKRFERIRSHFAFRFTKLGVAVLAVTLAVAIVATLTVDLGPGLRGARRARGLEARRPADAHRQARRPPLQRQVRDRELRHRRSRADRSPVPDRQAHRRVAHVGRDAPPRSAGRFGRDDRLAHGPRAVGRRQAQLSEVQHGRRRRTAGDSSRRCSTCGRRTAR